MILASRIFRFALVVTVALLLTVSQGPVWSTGAYLAVGISAVFGGLLIAGWPKSLRYRPLVGVLIDAAAITLLVAGTGGVGSLFSPLYFLAALGLARVRSVVSVSIGTAALILGYAVGVAAPERSFGPLLSYASAFEAGLIALFGIIAALGGASIRDVREKRNVQASALAVERRYAGAADSIASRIGPVLATLGAEEKLRWTVETVREALEVPYAHATTSDGSFHQTAVRGDNDAYPSWWHPEIQRLVLWSCRTGDVVRSDAEIHDTKGFLTMPLALENGENVGAIVAGGRNFDTEDERALRLLAVPVASALVDADEAPGGLDPVSGVPNRDSLDRVLDRELSLERPFSLVMVGLDFSGRSAWDLGLAARDSIIRAVGRRLKEANYRVFRCADGNFVVLLREVGGRRIRSVALKIRHIAESVTGPSGSPLVSTAAGFVVVERWRTGPGSLLDAARTALEEAQDRLDRVYEVAAGSSASETSEGLVGGGDTARIIRALEEAIEVRDPGLAEHSRAVSKMAKLIGAKMALPTEQIEILAVGGLLHDLGKIGLPDSILNKPAALSAEEYEIVKQHPILGAKILDFIPELSPVVPAVRHHHEWFDGGGYPDGLRGEDVPFPARVVLVADAFDSMTRDRVYRVGRDEYSALETIRCNSETQFDPEIVEVLREIITEPEGRRASL